jgi:hypothetical protein
MKFRQAFFQFLIDICSCRVIICRLVETIKPCDLSGGGATRLSAIHFLKAEDVDRLRLFLRVFHERLVDSTSPNIDCFKL